MICFKLTTSEIDRIKRAAESVGFPWQPIAERPKTARRFLTRVEAEMARNADRTATAWSTGEHGLRRERAAA